MRIVAALVVWAALGSAPAWAGKIMTAEEAIDDAEAALDTGRIGDAATHGEKLLKTRGLTKDQLRRVELILARVSLVQGRYGQAEKTFSRLRKSTPDDARLTEWLGRALEAQGKNDAAFALLSELAAKDALVEGDSYWALAQIEREMGKNADALSHAELALKKPIVLQSDELDAAIHRFIKELSSERKPAQSPKEK
jgi:tetratricopeptide (TPR) repeat protein